MATVGSLNTTSKEILGVLDDLNFWDAKRSLAVKGADLSFGQGVLITTEDETLQATLDRIRDYNHFDEFMLMTAEDGNYYGQVITTISKQGDNVLFANADPDLYQEVGVIEVTPIYAKLLIKKVVGPRVYYITEHWDAMKVTRSIDVWDAEMGDRRDLKPDEEVPTELNLPIEEIHGLGFVPFERYLNRPVRNIMATTGHGLNRLQDDYSVRHMPIHINNGLRQWFKEEILGKTRAYTSLPATVIEKLKQGGTESGLILDDLIVQINPGPNASKTVETQAGTFNDAPWSGALKSKANLYAIGCGYSPIFPDVVDPTVAESLISKDLDQRTTQQKKKRYTQYIENIIAKSLVMLGEAISITDAKEKFAVEIKENVIYNKQQLTEMLVYARDNGMSTSVEAIMSHRNLDNEADAQIILDKITKEQEAKAEKELKEAQALMQQQGNEGDAPADPTMPTQDADPVGDDSNK